MPSFQVLGQGVGRAIALHLATTHLAISDSS
ncbi:uncharacterized protein METZ01_LOCUS137926 [marine metagenome]|uniref:Uncharacterized protein n=1 Tax=marine metagenome TaxID=408172 RepID=A0A381Z862_9ZZZZ